MHARWIAVVALVGLCSVVVAQENAAPPIRGIVLRPDATPAVGAQVWLLQASLGLDTPAPAVTDQSGRFELPLPHAHPFFVYGRSAPPSVPGVVAILPDDGLAGLALFPDAGETTVELAPGGWVEIQAIDEDGGPPVEGADITWNLHVLDFLYNVMPPLRSGPDGMIYIGPLPAGYDISARVGGRSFYMQREKWAGQDQKVLVTAGKVAQLPPLLLVPNGRSFGGTVVDQDGAPVAGAVVQCNGGLNPDDPLSFRHLTTTTGQDGRFHFEGLLVWENMAVLASTQDRRLAYGQPINPDAVSDLKLPLHPLISISGRVVGPDGEPVPDIGVSAGTRALHNICFVPPSAFIMPGYGKTDGDGRWRIDRLVAGFEYWLQTFGGDLGIGTTSVIAEDDVADVEIVLGRDQ